MQNEVKLTIAGILGLIVLFVLWLSFCTIDEGRKGVILTFGEISKTVDSGLHFKAPFIQSLKEYDMRVQKATFGRVDEDDENPILSAYSYDQQIIESYRVSITYQLDPNRIEDIYRNFGRSEENDLFLTVVSPTVQQVTKAIFGQYTAQTIVQERFKLEKEIENTLINTLKKYPVIILSTQLEDVNFSRTYETIIEQTALKKQEIEKAKNELQRIEIESQQQIAQAEAKNKAVKLEADAKAYQIAVQAKAEADAIQMKGEALRANKELVELTKAERWNGVLPQTVLGDTTPLMQIK